MGGEEGLPVLGARAVGLAGWPMGHGPFLAVAELMTAEGCEVLELPKGSWHGSWTLTETKTERGIYFIDPSVKPATIKFFDLETRAMRRITQFEKNPVGEDPEICVSPDGQWLLYVQAETFGANIMVVEKFR